MKPIKRKRYSKAVRDIVADAKAFAKQRKAEGWTKADFAAGLKRMLDSKTGDDDGC